jgi:hypothetical protein
MTEIHCSCEPATNAMSLFFLQFDGGECSPSLALAESQPGCLLVYGAIGCHPHEAKHYTQEVGGYSSGA